MSQVIEDIRARIKALGAAEQTDLLRLLIADIDGPAQTESQSAWLKDAQRRQQEVIQGVVKPVPGEQVFAKLRARLKK